MVDGGVGDVVEWGCEWWKFQFARCRELRRLGGVGEKCDFKGYKSEDYI